MRRTKIIGTIGPASREPAVLQALIQAGLNIVRINASHTDPAGIVDLTELVRRVARLLDRPVSVLLDLCGPKVRLGEIEERTVRVGDRIGLNGTLSSPRDDVLPCNHPGLAGDVQIGHQVLVDDGLLLFHVDAIEGDTVWLLSQRDGVLKARKGINLPDGEVSIDAVTEKDLMDLAAGVEAGVDAVAVSFVQRARDIERVKDELARLHAPHVPVIAKIEKPRAVENLKSILEVADGAMVARGDLGVEAGAHRIAVLQKRILAECHRVGAIDIVATQMLDSMERNPTPTRAEASDVGNAILDGVDAVMLSGETAAGKYPVEAVKVMDRIAREVESAGFSMAQHHADETALGCEPVIAEIARVAAIIAEHERYKALLVLTATGRTARIVTAFYPRPPIYAVTPSQEACNRMTLLRNVRPLCMPFGGGSDLVVHRAAVLLAERGSLKPGDEVVVVAGTTEHPAAAHMVKVLTIPKT